MSRCWVIQTPSVLPRTARSTREHGTAVSIRSRAGVQQLGPVTAKVCKMATPNNSRELSKVRVLLSSKTKLRGIPRQAGRTAKCQEA